MHNNNATELQEICARAVDAFGLELSTAVTGKQSVLEVLKHDEMSMVIKAACVSSGVEQILVIKYVVESEFYGSEASARIQQFLGGGSSGRLTTSGQFLFRELLASGLYVVWSVNSYVPNGPSFDWLDAQPGWHVEHVDSAGELLSHIHQNASELASSFDRAEFKALPPVSVNVADWLSSAIEFAVDKAGTTSLMEPEVRRLVLKKVGAAAFNVIGGPHSARLNCEKVMIHGDYQPGNVLFNGDQALCAIDWDFAHLDHPLLDVAYGLIMFCGIAPRAAEIFDGRMTNAFLAGYKRGYRDRERLPYGLSGATFAECQKDRDGALNQYMKIAAGLILQWSFSRQGLLHPRGAVVREVAVRLILADVYA